MILVHPTWEKRELLQMCMNLRCEGFGDHCVWICVRIFFGNHLWISVQMALAIIFGSVFGCSLASICVCAIRIILAIMYLYFLHLLDHAGLDGCVGSGNYSNLKDWFNISISSSPYIEVKVDVHKTVAFPIRAIVVELSNLPILLFDDLEARSIRLKSAIACVELTLW